MRFERLTPMLWTKDLVGTMKFYQDTLGFKLDEYNPEWKWCHMHKDGVAIMFTGPHEDMPLSQKCACTGSFYIYTEEVDALWDELKTQVTVGYEIANFPHNMREFAILDNNGYMLQFGRDLKEGETITECE